MADAFVVLYLGTGVVKVTPAHDPNDWEMGQRHNLPLVNLLNPDGTMNENGLEWQGLSMADARLKVVERMKSLGLLVKVEPYRNRVGKSYRSKAVIEPYVSKQWFVKMEKFKQPLIDAVKDGQVRLVPDTWESTYYNWIENLRDWCISRQLWWGHRIPIWYHRDDPSRVICHAGDGVPPEAAEDPAAWIQDEDVLDTWFSSALWPFSTLGWPNTTADLQRFYPNSTLVTGHDILFWVARMVLMGQYVMEEVPFRDVSLLGLIYGKSYWRTREDGGIQYVSPEEKARLDAGETIAGVESKWEKMSKSKGNVLDPIAIIEKYGADAMRMALAASATQSQQLDLDGRRFEDYQGFANKVWNGTRFVLMNLSISSAELAEGLDTALLTLEDRWILCRLNATVRDINAHLEGFFYDRAAKQSYAFFWDEFCAYYKELVKPVLFGKTGDEALRRNKQRVLLCVLLASVRLMHPIAPFITEEIFQLLRERFPDLSPVTRDPITTDAVHALLAPACIVAPFPQPVETPDDPATIEEEFQYMSDIVYTIRNVRGEVAIPPSMESDLVVEGDASRLLANKGFIQALVRVGRLTVNPTEPVAGPQASAVVRGLKLTIPIPSELQSKERTRLEKEQLKLTTDVQSARQQLSNAGFVARAPPAVVEKARQALADLEAKLRDVEAKLS